MWQAFVTGFATQAAKDIEERHKEIQEQIYAEMESTYKNNEEVKKKAAKDAETRVGLARELNAMLSGTNLDPEKRKQIAIEMVRNPEAAKYFIEAVKDNRAGVDSINDFIILPKEEEIEDGREKPADLSEVFKARPATTQAAPPDFSKVTGPFGLPMGGSAQRARDFAMAKLRMTEEEAGGLEYTPPTPSLGVKFNYDALLKEKTDTIDRRINDASISLLDAKTPEEESKARAELERVLAVKSIQKQRTEGGARESDIRSNYRILSDSIMQSMAGPGDLVRDPETNAFMYSRTARPEVRAKIEAQKRQAFETSELTQSYKLPDGTLPPEVSRVISAFTYSSPTEQALTPRERPAPAPAPAPAPVTPAAEPAVAPQAPVPTGMSDTDRQQTVANAKAAVDKIKNNSSLSMGQKNGRVSLIRQRLIEAGINPKEAGL
jgi:hypothetical protein